MRTRVVIPVAAALGIAWAYYRYTKARRTSRSPTYADGLLGLIGKTPLIELRKLSAETGCRILAKAEHLNPGGSSKDRVAMWTILEAEKQGTIRPGDTMVGATCGNTGNLTNEIILDVFKYMRTYVRLLYAC